jgi:hypothetical protein
MKTYTSAHADFVVCPSSRVEPDQVVTALPEGSSVERLAGEPVTLLVHLAPGSDEELSSRVGELRRALRGRARIYPLLYDPAGNPAIPTGRVQVRFKGPVSDAQVARFAARHRLTAVRRNDFQPEQVEFEPADPELVHLPDAVDDASADEQVSLAWPETRSRYRKA